MNSASLSGLADRYDNPIPTWFLAPIDFLKIPALYLFHISALFMVKFFTGAPIPLYFVRSLGLYKNSLQYKAEAKSKVPDSGG